MKKTFKKHTNKIQKKGTNGITLIALVITIIVLLILAGISISMLSGDNSILSRATQAKTKTGIAQDEETISLAYLAAVTGKYADSSDMSATLQTELEKTYGSGKVTVTKSGDTYKVKIEEKGTYKIDGNGNVEKAIIADRTGIKVGDYITFTPSSSNTTTSVSFSQDETGYTGTNNTLSRKNQFRVMDIDSEGNMELIGAMTSDDPTICFSGAQGYNNAVSVLNNKCSELYKDTSKGITARSINEEDITKRFNSAGKKKMTDYIDERVGNVETETSNTLKTGTYIKSIDKTNKTVTYQDSGTNYRTNYPNIFQYEVGGKIGDTATSGVLARSAKPLTSLYGADEILTSADTEGDSATAIPQSSKSATTLTVPYTYSSTTHTVDDFDNSEGKASKWQEMFFGTGTYYWLASRCVDCRSGIAYFGVRFVNNSSLFASLLYYSNGRAESLSSRMCPVVSIPSSIQVEVKDGTSGTGAHVVK